VLDELRRTAAELDEFASGAMDRPQAQDAGESRSESRSEPPTERIPAKTEPQPSELEKGERAARARAKPRKPPGPAPTIPRQAAASDPSQSAGSASANKA